MSWAYATMWTCGIDIATQQLKPATTRTACSAFGDIPSGRGDRDATPAVVTLLSVSGERRRRTSTRGNIAATQKTAMPRYVPRHPALWMKCCTTGGQKVPAT